MYRASLCAAQHSRLPYPSPLSGASNVVQCWLLRQTPCLKTTEGWSHKTAMLQPSLLPP
jgi:hypothetical protein